MNSIEDRITAAVEELFDSELQFLEHLVSQPSLGNAEAVTQDFIASALETRGFAVSRIRTDASQIGKHPAFSPSTVDYADSWNIVGRKPAQSGLKGRSLAFNSHVDVVPAGSAHRWSKPPFTP